MTSGQSRFYDSRLSERPGRGYPSCNTELCRIPPNIRDPHGYYAELGVEPWASAEQIKARVRRLYRQLHPDTGALPDPQRMQRVKLIAEVLLDPQQRERYNRTPPGKRLLDGLYRSQLSALNFSGIPEKDLRDLFSPPPTPAGPRAGGWFDYLAVDRRAGDMHLAQRWYTCLVGVAPLVGYRRRVKVMIHDGPAFFHEQTAVMAIPRSWRPSKILAFALFTAVAGMPLWRHTPG